MFAIDLAIDLTITLYLVLQAVSPAFFGPLSDTLGRRPVVLITFSIYCAASLGLALNKHSYVALLVLRSLQSTGG
jgi:MFS family permease